jgi:hypothetical protein
MELLLLDWSLRQHSIPGNSTNLRHLKGSQMRGLKTLLCTAALVASLALAPIGSAQISINIGGPPPVCPYGYYGYAPYGCAPTGYYGPGYFYNGIFLGVGPWANWGYSHGWGSHRFVRSGGGRYTGGPPRGRPVVRPGRPAVRPAPRPGPRPGSPAARPGARPGAPAARPGGGARPGAPAGRPGGPAGRPATPPNNGGR